MNYEERLFKTVWTYVNALYVHPFVPPEGNKRSRPEVQPKWAGFTRPDKAEPVFCEGPSKPPDGFKWFGRELYIGVITNHHALYCVGDIVLVEASNGGGERWRACGWSTKKCCMIGWRYLRYQRYISPALKPWQKRHETPNVPTNVNCTVRLLVPPDGHISIGKRLVDPTVREFVLDSLRATSCVASQ